MAKKGSVESEVYRTHQLHTTLRYVVVGSVIVASLWIMADAFVKVAGVSQPAWVTLASIVALVVSASLAPSVQWISRLRLYMKTDHQRLTSLEAELDASRDSSGLDKTGVAPGDAL